MKKTFTLLVLLTVAVSLKAQVLTDRADGSATQNDQRLKVTQNLYIPVGTTATLNGGLDLPAALFFNTTINKLQVYSGTTWNTVNSDTDLLLYYTKNQVDSIKTVLNTAINLKANDGDVVHTTGGEIKVGDLRLESNYPEEDGYFIELNASGAEVSIGDLTNSRTSINPGILNFFSGSGIGSIRNEGNPWTSFTVLEIPKNKGIKTIAVTSDLINKVNIDGSNATGTWPISINGNAATASTVAWSGIIGKPTTFGLNVVALRNVISASSENFAVGVENTVTGDKHFAFGKKNNVSGADISGAFGYENTVSLDANKSFAFGSNNTVTSAYSTTIGRTNSVTGQYGFAAGRENVASGVSSVAIGTQNSSGAKSVAVGYSNEADGSGTSVGYENNALNASTALGYQNTASGSHALALGRENTASGGYSLSMGRSNSSTVDYAMSIGYNLLNNVAKSVKIGPSNSSYLLINNSGNVGIGTATDNGVDRLQVNGNGSFLNGLSITASSGSSQLTGKRANGTQLGYMVFSQKSNGYAQGQIGAGDNGSGTNGIMYWDGENRHVKFFGTAEGIDPINANDLTTKSWVENKVNVASAFANSTSRLYSTDPQYAYGSSNPYSASLTYNSTANRWRLQVSPATPDGIEVAYADIASSAINWGGRAANFDSNVTDLNVLVGRGSDEILRNVNGSQLKSFLGMPSGGETLASVLGRGNSTGAGNEIQVSADASGNGTYLYLGGNTPTARIGGYSSVNGVMPVFINDIGGNVIIGSSIDNTTDKLQVKGSIKAMAVKVDPNNWPDYVFGDSYSLPPLSKTALFIKENKHLPEVPSAKEVTEKGIELGEMNAILLKKIEELTLHLIDQEKRIKQLENK